MIHAQIVPQGTKRGKCLKARCADLFRGIPVPPMTSFREALMRHMADNGTTIAELAAGAGVTMDTIKKLRVRDNATTTAETAMRIAAFYGKTVEEFVGQKTTAERDQLAALLDLLSPEEQRFLLSQIRGMIRDRS